MVLAQKEKYRSMEQNRKPRNKSMVNLFMSKEARLYNGDETVFSINGVRKLDSYMQKKLHGHEAT